MATTTTNYGFIKPALTDSPPDITAPNGNWDTLDAKLKIIEDNGNMSSGSRKAATTIGANSHVEGSNNEASGENSHVEGTLVTAYTANSHAEGKWSLAAQGTAYIVKAFNNTSKTLTLNSVTSLVVGDSVIVKISNTQSTSTTITAINGLTITVNTTATIDSTWTWIIKPDTAQYCLHAEGYNSVASGDFSHVEGYRNLAAGDSSHVEGAINVATGGQAHVEGMYNYATGDSSHAEGANSMAATTLAAVRGIFNLACSGTTFTITAFNDTAKTITLNTVTGLAVGNIVYIKILNGNPVYAPISAINGLVVTLNTTETLTSSWNYAVLPTNGNTPTNTIGSNCMSSGGYSIAMGSVAVASGVCAFALGSWVTASGTYSHAEGSGTSASNECSHAEGNQTISTGLASHSEGSISDATGHSAHAEGYDTTASGAYSHSEGYGTNAVGVASHAGGSGSIAQGDRSFAQGRGVIASGPDQTVFGVYNANNTTDIFQVGCGTSESDRKNALTINGAGDYLGGKAVETVKTITSPYGTVTGGYVKIGRTVTFSIGVVFNTTVNPITAITITDQLPASTQYCAPLRALNPSTGAFYDAAIVRSAAGLQVTIRDASMPAGQTLYISGSYITD